MVNLYCTYTDVSDIIPNSVIGTGNGQVASGQILRLIEKSSGEIERWNDEVPFAQTTVTLEYHELVGLDKFVLDRYPVISITSLELQTSAGTWETEVQGRNEDTDDYFLEEQKFGLVRFHNVMAARVWSRITYIHGYATTPYWLRDLCSKMVAKAIFRLKVFDEECDDLFRFWMDEIRSYDKDIEKYRMRIDRRKKMARSMSARWATSSQSELAQLRACG